MRPTLLYPAIAGLFVLATACAVQPAPDEELGTVEQGLTSCDSVGLTEWRRGERLFPADVKNPWLVLTPGDHAESFYAWGVENGEQVLFVKRAPIGDLLELTAQVNQEIIDQNVPGADLNWGIGGSVIKGGPNPPPPPVGFPPELVAKVLRFADAQLAANKHFVDGLEELASGK